MLGAMGLRMRDCPKCGNMVPQVEYDAEADELQCQCVMCKYTWTEKTVDNLPAGAEEARVNLTITGAVVFVLIVIGAMLLAGAGGHG